MTDKTRRLQSVPEPEPEGIDAAVAAVEAASDANIAMANIKGMFNSTKRPFVLIVPVDITPEEHSALVAVTVQVVERANEMRRQGVRPSGIIVRPGGPVQ